MVKSTTKNTKKRRAPPSSDDTITTTAPAAAHAPKTKKKKLSTTDSDVPKDPVVAVATTATSEDDEEEEEIIMTVAASPPPKKRRHRTTEPEPEPEPEPKPEPLSKQTWVDNYIQISKLLPKEQVPVHESADVFKKLVSSLCRNQPSEFRQSLMTMYTENIVTFLCQLFVVSLDLGEMLNAKEFGESADANASAPSLSLTRIKSELKLTMTGHEKVNDILEQFVGTGGATSFAALMCSSSQSEVMDFLLSICRTMLDLNTRFEPSA